MHMRRDDRVIEWGREMRGVRIERLLEMVGSRLIYIELLTITLGVWHRQRNLLVHHVTFVSIISALPKATHCRCRRWDISEAVKGRRN